MTQLTERERLRATTHHFNIPLHAVIKPSSTKTKLRVVFDASAKSSSGTSLNDNLLVGPTIQADITILGRFRTFRIAMTADIEKMYRQVLMSGEDANYQRIVWRFSTEEAETDYKLNTVTYGTASAAYQAIRTLHQIADDESHISQRAADSIKENFYVDDYLGGAESVEATTKLKHNICKMLQNGDMILRGWKSNEPQLYEAEEQILLLDSENTSVLGLQWNSRTDTFGFKIQATIPARLTKRTFLSTSARVFDPLGFLSPVTVVAKIYFQRTWSLGLGWDDPIPEEIARRWKVHVGQYSQLSAVKIKRLLIENLNNVDLIGFADASEKAYAAVVYARNRHPVDNTLNMTLAAARTKVEPIRPVTLPRLELCAADLLTKLMKKIAAALSIDLKNCYAYSDSQVVLAWLSDNPRKWKTFVANRTANIIETIPPERWNYINSKDNPADCASRGLEPQQLINHKLWWHGPEHLGLYTTNFKSTTQSACIPLEERKVNVITTATEYISIEKYSDLRRFLRITALCLRFINNARSTKQHRISGHLQTEELKSALNTWLRRAQTDSFGTECDRLEANQPLPHNSQLQALAPFKDSDGILRVGGRIERSNLPYDEAHPVLLHRRHPLTRLIVSYTHLDNLHASHRLLLSILFRKYWTIGARLIAKQIIRECVTCTRHRGTAMQQKMASLPAVRVTPARPFLNSGVDYAGPTMVKSWRGRSGKVYKAYIALFICLSTKAIHIEAVTELTTECFLAALRRFVSRRGCPHNIYSDNGTNFVGANRELNKLYDFIKADTTQHAISQFSTMKRLNWHFIPPAAPHFGGIWEAGVKAVKFHINRVLGQTSVTFEELYTLLCQVEYCLNSRPLCSTSNPADDDVLTPNHFLIGSPGGLLPSLNSAGTKTNFIRRWKYIQTIHHDLWKRWQDEYLRQLQQRTKWITAANNLEVGQVVLIRNENTPPAVWPLAKVTKLHPGSDGCVRVVTLKTKDGILKRPICKVVRLPIEAEK